MDSESRYLVFAKDMRKRKNRTFFTTCCCQRRAILGAILMDRHRGNTSNFVSYFLKIYETSITNSKEKKEIPRIGVSKRRILFIVRTLLDDTTNKCEHIGPILIYYHRLTREMVDREKRRLVFVSDLYFLWKFGQAEQYVFNALCPG